ncbi:hypothetical protein SeGA_5636 [Salmonella enterica subsp. enterica serovar Gaminara str. A4-567]|nr:hypothetical protein SeGA_5636 [Salmonella enterica subsp. enterica serovar Gaminara str. A4-567]
MPTIGVAKKRLRAGVGTALYERVSPAGADTLGGCRRFRASGVCSLARNSALIQVNCR